MINLWLQGQSSGKLYVLVFRLVTKILKFIPKESQTARFFQKLLQSFFYLISMFFRKFRIFMWRIYNFEPALANQWSHFLELNMCKHEGQIEEACIGVLGIQDICQFTLRDIGYFPFYFQGYGILCSISGILLFYLQNIQIQSINTNNINKNPFKFSSKEEKLYVHDMASFSRPGPLDRV